MKRSLVVVLIFMSLSLWGAVGFVVNSGSETLSRLDFETGEIDNTFAVLGSMPNRVALTSEYAYVVNSGDNSIQKIDLQTGATLANIFIAMSSNPYDILIVDDFTYVSGGLDNKVYKIDLTIDEVVGSVEVGGNPAGMTELNNKLYVGNTDYGTGYANCSVSIIDLSTFTVTNTVPSEVNPHFLKVINGNIHISCGGDWATLMGKICVLDPTSETIVETIDLGGVTSNFAVAPGNTVYVGDGFGYSLYAYNSDDYSVIYNGAAPFASGGSMVTADEDYLYVLGGEWGQNFTVKKFDFNENLVNEYTVALYATDIKLMPEETGTNNFEVPVASYQLSNYPNPFNPSTTISFHLTTETTENTEIAIYNLKGQKVKTLMDCYTAPGKYECVWNGKDETGKVVSSGQYVIKLKQNGKETAKKIMMLK